MIQDNNKPPRCQCRGHRSGTSLVAHHATISTFSPWPIRYYSAGVFEGNLKKFGNFLDIIETKDYIVFIRGPPHNAKKEDNMAHEEFDPEGEFDLTEEELKELKEVIQDFLNCQE